MNSDLGKGQAGASFDLKEVSTISPAPVTSTVISNMRGRNIISGSKELLVNVNGQGLGTPIIETVASDQSTHRISNEKLDEFRNLPKGEALNSAPFTPNAAPDAQEARSYSKSLHQNGLNKDI